MLQTFIPKKNKVKEGPPTVHKFCKIRKSNKNLIATSITTKIVPICKSSDL